MSGPRLGITVRRVRQLSAGRSIYRTNIAVSARDGRTAAPHQRVVVEGQHDREHDKLKRRGEAQDDGNEKLNGRRRGGVRLLAQPGQQREIEREERHEHENRGHEQAKTVTRGRRPDRLDADRLAERGRGQGQHDAGDDRPVVETQAGTAGDHSERGAGGGV